MLFQVLFQGFPILWREEGRCRDPRLSSEPDAEAAKPPVSRLLAGILGEKGAAEVCEM